MAQDYNIYIKNGMGGKAGARQKLSAKGSIARNKNTMNISATAKKISGTTSNMINSASSSSGFISISKTSKGLGFAGVVAAAILTSAEKIASFGINLREAKTGEQVRANNSRATIKTITSFGTNYITGAIQNELFTKRIISRQNFGLDYGRELYQINVEGYKNKRI